MKHENALWELASYQRGVINVINRHVRQRLYEQRDAKGNLPYFLWTKHRAACYKYSIQDEIVVSYENGYTIITA